MKQDTSYPHAQVPSKSANTLKKSRMIGASSRAASGYELDRAKSQSSEILVDSLLRQVPACGTALIVEDHPLYRDALIRLLHVILGDQGIVAASSAEKGLKSAVNIPDLRLVLLDVGLPGLSGTEAVMAFRKGFPAATVIVVSASEDRRDVTSAFRAGAHAFVSKAVPTEVLANVVRRILAGAMPQPEWIVSSGAGAFADTSLPALTPRQREILTLLSQGHSNKEMGLRLDLAEVTVKLHVSSIFRALGVANRTQAVLMARRLALCEAGQEAS